jgi:hypothetical protein
MNDDTRTTTVPINEAQAEHVRRLRAQIDLAQSQYENAVRVLLMGSVDEEGTVELREVRDNALVFAYKE